LTDNTFTAQELSLSSFDVDLGLSVALEGSLQILPEPMFSVALTLDELPLFIAQPYIAEFAHVSLDHGLLSLEG
jgi:hypothetical protein